MRDYSRYTRIFTNSIGLKLVVLLCAIAIWVYSSLSESQTGYFPGNLPVEIRNIPSKLALMNEKEKVKVKLRAPFKIWGKINVDNLKADINLAGLGKGIHEVNVDVSTNLPNLVILEKEPSKIIVRLEDVIEKAIPVNVLFEGGAKPGFVSGETIVEPENVKIKGPESLVSEISQADINVNIDGKSRNFSQKVPLNTISDKSFKDKKIDFKPRSVDVLVNIIPGFGSKTVGVKVKTKGRLKPNYYISKIESIPSVIDISSKENSSSEINFLETEEIDLGKLEKNTIEEVNLLIPNEISSKVKKVKVKITLAVVATERQIIASFEYNPNPEFRITNIEPVKVMVSGPANIINKLNPDKVKINLELMEKNLDVNLITITKEMISVPKDVEIINWFPRQVEMSWEKY